jgi:hypothetical protein
LASSGRATAILEYSSVIGVLRAVPDRRNPDAVRQEAADSAAAARRLSEITGGFDGGGGGVGGIKDNQAGPSGEEGKVQGKDEEGPQASAQQPPLKELKVPELTEEELAEMKRLQDEAGPKGWW